MGLCVIHAFWKQASSLICVFGKWATNVINAFVIHAYVIHAHVICAYVINAFEQWATSVIHAIGKCDTNDIHA